ncbi:Protoheme IX farnesyltransferase [bacterium HR39]|nr:Protoheme IX farnesyltransferase [bacterium HR39]
MAAKPRLRPVAGEAALAAASLGDWWRLFKPNVMQLSVFTAAVGLYLAPGYVHPFLAAVAVFAIAAGAGAAAALNNAYDADIDRIMARTRGRPTARGRIDPAEAAGAGVVLGLIAVAVLGLSTNWLAAGLLAGTILFYAVVYTMLLKRRTPQNIVIGGAAGALPPVVGWAAAAGRVDPEAWILFALIFLWTPPHFWALALYRAQDYAAAGVPMLPVVAGRRATIRQIRGYAWLVVAVSLLPPLVGMAGWLYAAVAVAAGGAFLFAVERLVREGSDRAAARVFRTSIVQLFALFAGLVVDRALGSFVGV